MESGEPSHTSQHSCDASKTCCTWHQKMDSYWETAWNKMGEELDRGEVNGEFFGPIQFEKSSTADDEGDEALNRNETEDEADKRSPSQASTTDFHVDESGYLKWRWLLWQFLRSLTAGILCMIMSTIWVGYFVFKVVDKVMMTLWAVVLSILRGLEQIWLKGARKYEQMYGRPSTESEEEQDSDDLSRDLSFSQEDITDLDKSASLDSSVGHFQLDNMGLRQELRCRREGGQLKGNRKVLQKGGTSMMDLIITPPDKSPQTLAKQKASSSTDASAASLAAGAETRTSEQWNRRRSFQRDFASDGKTLATGASMLTMSDGQPHRSKNTERHSLSTNKETSKDRKVASASAAFLLTGMTTPEMTPPLTSSFMTSPNSQSEVNRDSLATPRLSQNTNKGLSALVDGRGRNQSKLPSTIGFQSKLTSTIHPPIHPSIGTFTSAYQDRSSVAASPCVAVFGPTDDATPPDRAEAQPEDQTANVDRKPEDQTANMDRKPAPDVQHRPEESCVFAHKPQRCQKSKINFLVADDDNIEVDESSSGEETWEDSRNSFTPFEKSTGEYW